MLKRFTLKNYKNFKDEITIDFENIAGYQFNTDCLSGWCYWKNVNLWVQCNWKDESWKSTSEYYFNNVRYNKIYR